MLIYKINMVRFFLLFFLIILSKWCFSNPTDPPVSKGPKPPPILYRADVREPSIIFAEGFRTWASNNNRTPNNSVMEHIAGDSIGQDGDSNWVSTSEGLERSVNIFNAWRRTNGSLRWLYEVSTSSAEYNVTWMLEDFAPLAHDPQDIHLTINTFRNDVEWLSQGGIPSSRIIRAVRYRYDAEDEEWTQDTASGSVLENTHYVQQHFLLQSQTQNPAREYDRRASPPPPVPLRPPIFGYEVPPAVPPRPDPPPVPPRPDPRPEPDLVSLVALGIACLGVANSNNNNGNTEPKECDYSDNARKDTRELVSRPSVIYVKGDQSTNIFCLNIVNNMIQKEGVYELVYFWLVTPQSETTDCERNIAVYDQNARLNFVEYHALTYNDIKMDLCPVAPRDVIYGSKVSGLIEIWPCDNKDPMQFWKVVNGTIKPYGNRGFAVGYDETSKQVVLYKKGINDNNIKSLKVAQEQMTEEFFTDPSFVINQRYEIGLSWFIHNHLQYFPTTDSNSDSDRGGLSEKYNQKTYYDDNTKTLSILESVYVNASANRFRYKCAVTPGVSNWVGRKIYWKPCDQRGFTVPDNRHIWRLNYADSAGFMTEIEIRDVTGKPLIGDKSNEALFIGGLLTPINTKEFYFSHLNDRCLYTDRSWRFCDKLSWSKPFIHNLASLYITNIMDGRRKSMTKTRDAFTVMIVNVF